MKRPGQPATLPPAHVPLKTETSRVSVSRIKSQMASIAVISCHSHVSRPCCMLSAPPHFFLFNCPSGSTRYSSDQRLRIARCTRIYISRLAEDCLGGLPGMLFCIQEARGSENGVLLVGDSPHTIVKWPLVMHIFRSGGLEALVCQR